MAIRVSKKAMALRGTTILVGRDPYSDSLLVSAIIKGKRKETTLTACSNVPRNVSRCNPGENIAHCKLTIDERGIITVTNLKSSNKTFVNNIEIVTKRIDENDTIGLGGGKFPVAVKSIIDALVPDAVEKSPLEETRKRFETSLRRVTIQARTKKAVCNTSILIAILAWTCTIVFKKAEIGEGYYITSLAVTIIAAIAVIVKHAGMYKMSHIEERNRVITEYLTHYTCPHCGRFLGDITAEQINKTNSCPACNNKILTETT